MTYLQGQFQEECRHQGYAKNWLFTEIAGMYQVTTAYRQSSTYYPTWYYETFVWRVNGKERDLIGDETRVRDHFAVVKSIIEKGGYVPSEEVE